MLEITDLSVAYGGAAVLRQVTLNVGAGEVVALLGSNGAGKSTLFRAIYGLATVVGGSIRFDGRDITGLPGHQITRQGLAQVAEGRQCFTTLSVADNLLLGGYYGNRDRKRASAKREEVLELFPVLRQRLRQLAGSLSGGEQQMLAVARALMAEPRLLLMDEPSLGMAPKVVRDLFQITRNLHRQGIPVLISEQNARAALEIADRAYILENGRIVGSGPAAQLRRDPEVVARYLGG